MRNCGREQKAGLESHGVVSTGNIGVSGSGQKSSDQVVNGVRKVEEVIGPKESWSTTAGRIRGSQRVGNHRAGSSKHQEKHEGLEDGDFCRS